MAASKYEDKVGSPLARVDPLLRKEHQRKTEELSQQIKQFYDQKTPFRLYHGSTNSTRPSIRTHTSTLDISHLDGVLNIDIDTRTCLVEPNVPMDALLDVTLKQGLVPFVVPELPGITVGGAFAGTSGESSSFKDGLFDNTVNWCEVILANGTVMHCSEDDNTELFTGLKSTFGTVGIVTVLEIRLRPATSHVELTYHPVRNGIQETKNVLAAVCADVASTDYVDGIMFSPDRGVVISGRLVNFNEKTSSLPIHTFHRRSDDWFYLHAEKIVDRYTHDETHELYRELVPIKSYFFRYDRGAFWTGRYAYKYFLTPFNKTTRYLLDGFMHTREMFHALHRSGLMHQFIIQDMAVPWSQIGEFSRWLDKEVHTYPVWLCPLRVGKLAGGLPLTSDVEADFEASEGTSMMLNFGVWGPVKGDSIQLNRSVEAKLQSLQGVKVLYAQTFYTEDEFWLVYNRDAYTQLRRRYCAETLPDIYTKVGGNGLHAKPLMGWRSCWPIAGIHGVLSLIKGGDYLRKS